MVEGPGGGETWRGEGGSEVEVEERWRWGGRGGEERGRREEGRWYRGRSKWREGLIFRGFL